MITTCLKSIPRISRHPNRRLPPDLLDPRRLVRDLMKNRWGSRQYFTARKTYREDLANYINTNIEETLDSAGNPEFFHFTSRHRANHRVPSLTLNGQCYSGHARVAECFADYHGESTPLVHSFVRMRP